MALYNQIKAAGYSGGYSRVTDFIREWRGSSKAVNAFVPLAFELGEAFQFDWSEEGVVVGSIYHRAQVSHMKLCASHAFWLVGLSPSGPRDAVRCPHAQLRCAGWDRPPRHLRRPAGSPLGDNMKTAVDKGNGRVVNTRFSTMCTHYLFDADFCNATYGWEKGVVEKNVQDSRRRIWIDAKEQRFGSFAELNAWLGNRCRAWWEEIRHPKHDQFSVAEMLEHEQTYLMPMPAPLEGYVEKPARVSSTCLVSVARNRYSVPCEFAGQRVSTHLHSTNVRPY